MRFNLSAFLLSLVCLPLLAQVSAPRIGTARYPDGSLHTVQGLPFNMIVADLPLASVEASSFSDEGGMVSRNGVIRLLGKDFSVVAEYTAAEKPLLSIDGGLNSALAWLPGTHVLVHWTGSKFETIEVQPNELDGTVTDLQSAGPRQARLIVEHQDGSVSATTISLRTGNLVSSEPLPGVQGYAFGQSFFVLYVNGKELVADNLRGYRRSVPVPAADISIERMSDNWLEVSSPSLHQNWALHITQSALELSEMPGLPVVASNRRVGVK
jgi:hypothetical protein